MDETVLQVAGTTLWLHVIGHETTTSYRLRTRGTVWKGYAGAVHDTLSSYWHLPEENRHGLCNADLEEIVELEKQSDGWVAHWCGATGGPVPVSIRRETAVAWDTLLGPVLDHYKSLPLPARGRHRGHNLTRYLWKEQDICLLFMTDSTVPFTNN